MATLGRVKPPMYGRPQQVRLVEFVRGDTLSYIQSARDAELNAADQMRYLGYTDATAMPVGPDGGIDVFSKNALAQVKWKRSVASRPDMQRLYGARGAQTHKQLYFFALAGYSRHAVEYANANNISLFVY